MSFSEVVVGRDGRHRVESLGLVVDADGHLAQLVLMLAGVMSTEEQLGSAGKFHADIRLCATTIASIDG